jgi:hypothetical protein
VVAFAFLSIIICFIHFIFFSKNSTKKEFIIVKLGESKSAKAGKAQLTVAISGILRPLFGNVKAKLIFADYSQSESIILDANIKQNKWIRSGIYGSKWVWLPDRKVYKVKGIIIFFEDFLGLFSFSIYKSRDNFIYTTSPYGLDETLSINPNQTEEEIFRIDSLKKIQGELINYKTFEPGDDIRRIVWKIYAKNKELVIKIPEIKDRYASHVYIFVSYLNNLQTLFSEDFDNHMLNYYKDKVRIIYESCKKTNVACKLFIDQEINEFEELETDDRDIFKISVATWQKNYELETFFNRNASGIYVLPTLIEVTVLENVLQNFSLFDKTLIIVKVSDSFKKLLPFSWQKLFFDVPELKENKIKRDWLLSGYRHKVLKNEKKIQSLLNQYSVKHLWY